MPQAVSGQCYLSVSPMFFSTYFMFYHDKTRQYVFSQRVFSLLLTDHHCWNLNREITHSLTLKSLLLSTFKEKNTPPISKQFLIFR